MPATSTPWTCFAWGALSLFSLRAGLQESCDKLDFTEEFKELAQSQAEGLASDWQNVGLDIGKAINHYVQQEKQGQITGA